MNSQHTINAHPVYLQRNERGAVLAITLILMVILTVLAVGTLSMSTTQTRIATNTADAQVAFQTAEGALTQLQSDLLAGTYPDSNFYTNANGFYIFDPAVPPLLTTIDWTSSSAVVTNFQGNSASPSAFFIELLPSFVRPGQSAQQITRVYRATVRAVGPSGGSPVILQATVQVQQ